MVSLIISQCFLRGEVDNRLIVIDHAPDVRPAVDGDRTQAGRRIRGIFLIFVPCAVIIPAVELTFGSIIICNVQFAQINGISLRDLIKSNRLVGCREVTVAVDHNIDRLLLRLDIDTDVLLHALICNLNRNRARSRQCSIGRNAIIADLFTLAIVIDRRNSKIICAQNRAIGKAILLGGHFDVGRFAVTPLSVEVHSAISHNTVPVLIIRSAAILLSIPLNKGLAGILKRVRIEIYLFATGDFLSRGLRVVASICIKGDRYSRANFNCVISRIEIHAEGAAVISESIYITCDRPCCNRRAVSPRSHRHTDICTGSHPVNHADRCSRSQIEIFLLFSGIFVSGNNRIAGNRKICVGCIDT